MKKTWIEVVREKMEQQKLKQDDIADALDKTQGAIGHWLNQRRKPDFNEVANILKAVGIKKVILNSDGTLEDFDTNAKKEQVKPSFTYPLVSAVQAGAFTETYDLQDSESYEMIDSEIETKGQSFFLRITGESMLPKFSENDLVLIDTGKQPYPGNYVAAVNGSGEATFKMYKQLGELSESGNPHFELVPLNSVFPTLSSLKQDIRIIGVAVEHRSYL
ncbi:LexA family protein [Phocoenobacter skyensis]|uniref:LexA family transcriptional regulator n=1 Tax=Phocoenobacter skyensis TaxID=97481 RepID=A0ABT9JIB5_9PAST|nr:LexA family transcriptional regulator [Pasteurella skyensis]MDP8078359.1 LexA family transcriptional regulator [Pasteurella skyensis]MDP8084549.1 LexA family transcriptional regulator [Pasteurella skyensis]